MTIGANKVASRTVQSLVIIERYLIYLPSTANSSIGFTLVFLSSSPTRCLRACLIFPLFSGFSYNLLFPRPHNLPSSEVLTPSQSISVSLFFLTAPPHSVPTQASPLAPHYHIILLIRCRCGVSSSWNSG